MVAIVQTSSLYGVEALPIRVEVQVRPGSPRFTIIGLADGSIRESRDRVIAALRHSGFYIPEQVLINLAPADLRKEGSAFDVAIAIGILVASKQIKQFDYKNISFFGELSLDGKIKPVRGILVHVALARALHCQDVVVPLFNAEESALVTGIRSMPFETLTEIAQFLNGKREAPRFGEPVSIGNRPGEVKQALLDQVWGQEQAKRALMIAAAGGHNMLMVGPPGCGKSMLAQRMGSLLPPLTLEDRLETIRIHSVAGLPTEDLLRGERPYRQPHHVISDVGLVGGGPKLKPGEASLAHHGILFLDEFPEFRRSALEALRAPLENGNVQITRAHGCCLVPARFQLVAAMNPCPCGRLGLPAQRGVQACQCSRRQVEQYLSKLSQPILDRIDLQVELEPVPAPILTTALNSAEIPARCAWRDKVESARERQRNRIGKINARLEPHELKQSTSIAAGALGLIDRITTNMQLSARGVLKVVKVALTIADLEGSEVIGETHIAEAIGLRSLERLQRQLQRL